MTDKELLIKYFEDTIIKLEKGGGEPHKVYLAKEKIKSIDWWVGTKWGQDMIKKLKEDEANGK
jgi:hypothetical protein